MVVVFPPPVFQDDPSLGQRPELLPIKALKAEPGIEALDVAILPWAALVGDGLNLMTSARQLIAEQNIQPFRFPQCLRLHRT